MRNTTGEVGTNSKVTYSSGPLHMDEQRPDDQLEPTYNGICRPSYQPDKCGTRPFKRWVRVQDRSRDVPDISQICLGPCRHSLKKGRLRRQAINLTPPRRVKACGDGPLRLKVCPETGHTRLDMCH